MNKAQRLRNRLSGNGWLDEIHRLQRICAVQQERIRDLEQQRDLLLWACEDVPKQMSEAPAALGHVTDVGFARRSTNEAKV
jgi:hypothetical protein